MYLKIYKAISCLLCLGRDIYYAKYYGGGGGWPPGKKVKKQGIGGKIERGKEKRGKINKITTKHIPETLSVQEVRTHFYKMNKK